MHSPVRKLRAFLMCFVIAAAFTSVSVGSAAAASATWSPGGGVTGMGTVTLTAAKAGGGTTQYTCSTFLVSFLGLDSATYDLGPYPIECSGPAGSGTLGLGTDGYATQNKGAYSLTFYGGQSIGTLFPSFYQEQFTIPWTNKAGSTPAYMTFSNTLVGYNYYGAVRATGKLTVYSGSSPTPTLK